MGALYKRRENKRSGLERIVLITSVQFSHSVMSNSVSQWTAACQASLSITNSQSLLKLMSIESVMPSNYLILYWPLLLLPSMFLSIRVFSNESALYIRWPKYWCFTLWVPLNWNVKMLLEKHFIWINLCFFFSSKMISKLKQRLQ